MLSVNNKLNLGLDCDRSFSSGTPNALILRNQPSVINTLLNLCSVCDGLGLACLDKISSLSEFDANLCVLTPFDWKNGFQVLSLVRFTISYCFVERTRSTCVVN